MGTSVSETLLKIIVSIAISNSLPFLSTSSLSAFHWDTLSISIVQKLTVLIYRLHGTHLGRLVLRKRPSTCHWLLLSIHVNFVSRLKIDFPIDKLYFIIFCWLILFASFISFLFFLSQSISSSSSIILQNTQGWHCVAWVPSKSWYRTADLI